MQGMGLVHARVGVVYERYASTLFSTKRSAWRNLLPYFHQAEHTLPYFERSIAESRNLITKTHKEGGISTTVDARGGIGRYKRIIARCKGKPLFRAQSRNLIPSFRISAAHGEISPIHTRKEASPLR